MKIFKVQLINITTTLFIYAGPEKRLSLPSGSGKG